MIILIPTCRPAAELSGMRAAILANTSYPVIASGLPRSAAVNRNYCLAYVAENEIAIMLDDDIEGFYHGWIDDLVAPLVDPAVVMVSARLLVDERGLFGPTCSRCYDPTPDEIEIKSNGGCVLPTAAIAFRHRGHKFDEHYVGSGFEDNDFCFQYLAADPSAKFIQSNKCRLIHRNEMKNQGGRNWKHNQAYFFNKWRPSRATA